MAGILIIDDDPSIRAMFTRALQALGDVESAANGAEALRLLASRKYGVVLLDLVPVARHQPDLFDAADERQHRLSPLIDRINDRYGRYALGFGLLPPEVRSFKVDELRDAKRKVLACFEAGALAPACAAGGALARDKRLFKSTIYSGGGGSLCEPVSASEIPCHQRIFQRFYSFGRLFLKGKSLHNQSATHNTNCTSALDIFTAQGTRTILPPRPPASPPSCCAGRAGMTTPYWPSRMPR